MTRKKLANIRQELVGELFFDGKDYYKLTICQTEPTATLESISKPDLIITRPISEFADFVQLKPLRPIKKKPTRAPRKDKGGIHRQASRHTETPADVTIRTPTGDETDYVVRIRDIETAGPTLRLAVLGTLEEWGGKIPDDLSEDGKRQLEAILKEE